LQAKAKWQRLVERHFPPTAPHMAAQQNQHSGGASGSTASRGGRGGSNSNTRPSRGGGSGGTNRGGGNAGQGFANRTSRVNPRPSNAGPPAKVRITVKGIFPSENEESRNMFGNNSERREKHERFRTRGPDPDSTTQPIRTQKINFFQNINTTTRLVLLTLILWLVFEKEKIK